MKAGGKKAIDKMRCYIKLTSKYSITQAECCPNDPEYIIYPPRFSRISCISKKGMR